MDKKIWVMLILILVMTAAVPVFAKTEVKKLDNGKFKVTWIYDEDLDASQVFVAGKFNDWSASDSNWELKKKDGVWKLTKKLSAGEYEYKFVINGSEWKKDKEAEEFAADGKGGQNSVLKIGINNWKGKFNAAGELKNVFEQAGTSAPVSFENQLKLNLAGTAFKVQEQKKIKRLEYESELTFHSDIAEIKDAAESDILTLDQVEINDFDTTYIRNIFDFNLEATTEETAVSSKDYLQLIETKTNNDDRGNNTKNLNSLGDVRRFKVSTDQGLELNLTASEYTDKLTESSEVNAYLNRLEAEKSFFNNKLELGSSVFFYQPVVMGEKQQTARSTAVYSRYNFTDHLTLKGEYARVPQGSVTQSPPYTRKVDGGWKFVFDPEAEDIEAEDIKEVYIVGDFATSWGHENYEQNAYQLTKQTEDDVWTKTFSDKVEAGDKFKFLLVGEKSNLIEYDWFDWDQQGFSWYPDDNQVVKQQGGIDGTSDLYMTELDFDLVDKEATMNARVKKNDYSIIKYSGHFNVGAEVKEPQAAVPLAEDSLNENKETGYKRAYADAEYKLLKDLTLSSNFAYKYQYQKPETTLQEKIKTGIDWQQPMPGLDYLQTNLEYDPAGESSFKVINPNSSNITYSVKKLFAETKTTSIPGLKTLKVNTTQRLKAAVKEYNLAAELDIPTDQITHIKADLEYVDTSGNNKVEDSGFRYSAETKWQGIAAIKNYLPYVVINYERDDNLNFQGSGLVDDPDDDSDNDWKNKLYTETKLTVPQINNIVSGLTWDGLTIKGDLKQLENNIADIEVEEAAAFTEERKYYLAEEGTAVNWYSIVTLETGFELPFAISSDLTVKYDCQRKEISEYEDNALLFELTKKVKPNTTITASYNKQDGDEGDNYSKLMITTKF